MEDNAIPIIPGLFTWPTESPELIAGKCKTCGFTFFPIMAQAHEPTCTHHDVEQKPLGRTGTLFSYTIHYYQPPPPFRMEPFEPYAVGAVSLPENLKVLGMLTGIAFDKIQIGMPCELVIESLYKDEKGNEHITYKWKAG
ncbi:MAG: OB-fold domain-containing protein [Deltaproteobacteria bacterium]|nr:OB-fold domain-containing protein [Deltaproteobacteria bacterium]